MKTFNKFEKNIIREISALNGNKFSDLFRTEIKDCKVVLKKEEDKVSIHYKTKAFTPTQEELKTIEKTSNELFKKIVLTVQASETLINKGLISLYSKEEQPKVLTLGESEISDLGLIQNIEDAHIRDVFLRLSNQILIVSPDLNSFIKKGFRTVSEYRELWQYRLSWFGISIALITSMIGIFMNLNPNYEIIVDKQSEIISEIKLINQGQKIKIEQLENLINSFNKKDSLNEQTNNQIIDLKKAMQKESWRIRQVIKDQ